MARIACFVDDTEISDAIQNHLYSSGHEWCFFSASYLTGDIRAQVQSFAPELILLELNASIDNAHLFFFLCIDRHTRQSPIVFVSNHDDVEQHMLMLDADACMQHPFSANQFWDVLVEFVQLERAIAA